MTNDEILRMAKEQGARDVVRVAASVALAIKSGDDPQATFNSVRKWNPSLFGAKPTKQTAPTLSHWSEPDYRMRKMENDRQRRASRRHQ